MLNREWQIGVFAQALAATVDGAYIFVGPTIPEVEDLVAKGFLKLDKRKKDEAGNVSATAVSGVTEDQVRAALTAADVAAAPVPAPVPTATETLAPQTPAPVPAPAADTTVQLAATAQPVFNNAETQLAVGDVVLGSTDHAVVDTVELGGEQFEIETGVQFVKRAPNIANISRQPREDKYPFAVIAELKARPENIDNDEFLPSFHVANKQLKNMSNLMSKYIKQYEASHGVTFRGRQVKESDNDPKGAGVRIFAMNPKTAPERKSPIRKKTAATAETLAASPATPVVDGSEQYQQG